MEDDTWKDNFYATALRNKGNVKVATVDSNGNIVSVDNLRHHGQSLRVGGIDGLQARRAQLHRGRAAL